MDGGHSRYCAPTLILDFNTKAVQQLLRHDVDAGPLCIGNSVGQRGVFANNASLDLILDVDVKMIPIHFATSTSSTRHTSKHLAGEDAVTEET